MGSVIERILWPRVPANVDDAQEIGAVPVRTPVTAMRVGRTAGDAVLRYLGEVPMSLAWAWRLGEDAEGRRYRWWRLEAKVGTRNGAIARGQELVVAQHPYANGWLHHARFKPGSKKGALERPTPAPTARDSVAAFVAAVEKLDQDYWEKGNYLTAGISQPDLPFSPGDTVRNVQGPARYLFGVCDNFAACERALLPDGHLQRLLRATERGTLRFWAPRAKLKGRPKLYDEVKTEGLVLMALAIRQALAGPHEHSEGWQGKPVVAKVDQIYRGHLNQRNRQLARQQGRLTEYDDTLAYDATSDRDADAWDAFEDEPDDEWET